MSGAEGVLAINIAVAGLFAAAYAVLGFTNASQRRALAFTASYVIGMASPAVEFFVMSSTHPELLEWVAYTSFLAATLSISAAFTFYHGQRIDLAPLALLLWMGLALRAITWSIPRDTLVYGMAYQAPFVLAAGLAMHSVLSVPNRGPLHLSLTAVFGLLGVNFLSKPFVLASLGSGGTIRDYIGSTYALISQASTGILLLAAGVLLLLIVAQKTIGDLNDACETDPLSQLANRRGFERKARGALSRAAKAGLPVSVAAFDLDHFKRINDSFGHDVGDAVIVQFANHLRNALPAGTLVGRIGGEEFVALFEGLDAAGARLAAEGVRVGLVRALPKSLPAVTVSGGVAQQAVSEDLTALMTRADEAAYAAKRLGRNRVRLAECSGKAPETAPRAQVGRAMGTSLARG
jgi:diguanylate cyclase (GGDEF)-like protein